MPKLALYTIWVSRPYQCSIRAELVIQTFLVSLCMAAAGPPTPCGFKAEAIACAGALSRRSVYNPR